MSRVRCVRDLHINHTNTYISTGKNLYSSLFTSSFKRADEDGHNFSLALSHTHTGEVSNAKVIDWIPGISHTQEQK